MQLLTITAALHSLHQQVFRCHKGHILTNRFINDFFVYMQTVRYILCKAKNGVSAQKALRHGNAAVGGIIQRALQPLNRSSHVCVHCVRHQISRQRADAFRTHGVALVGHGRGADLVLFKGFLYLAVMLEQADIVSHTVAALSNGRQAVQNAAVYLAGVSLTADIKALLKAKIGGNHAVHFIDLSRVALEQFHEAGLRTGSAAAAQEFDVFNGEVDFTKVAQEILHPQRGALAHRHQLCGLVVGVAQSGQCLVLLGKIGQIGDYL